MAFTLLCMLQSGLTWSMLQSQTITFDMLQTEATVASAAILLLFLFCVAAMLPGTLSRATGH